MSYEPYAMSYSKHITYLNTRPVVIQIGIVQYFARSLILDIRTDQEMVERKI